MPPKKTGGKKETKSEDDTKKKESTKNSKKNVVEDTGDLGSATTGNTSSKTGTGNLPRGTTQLGTPTEESINKEAGGLPSEPSQLTEGNREGGETGDITTGTGLSDADIKYEEPILPNLIVLRFVYI